MSVPLKLAILRKFLAGEGIYSDSLACAVLHFICLVACMDSDCLFGFLIIIGEFADALDPQAGQIFVEQSVAIEARAENENGGRASREPSNGPQKERFRATEKAMTKFLILAFLLFAASALATQEYRDPETGEPQPALCDNYAKNEHPCDCWKANTKCDGTGGRCKTYCRPDACRCLSGCTS